MIWLWISWKLIQIFLWSKKLKLTIDFRYLNLLWQVNQFLPGLIEQVKRMEFFYFQGYISCKIFKNDFDADFQELLVEKSLKKWLLCCYYNLHKSNIENHLKRICKTLDRINISYDNLVMLGYFNAEPEEESIAEFLILDNLKNLAEQNTCFKNPDKPTCIADLILTNYPPSFQDTGTSETELSDFCKPMLSLILLQTNIITVLWQHFLKQNLN